MRSVFQTPVSAYWLEDDECAAEHPHDITKHIGVELR